MTTNTNTNKLMNTLAHWRLVSARLGARGIDAERLGTGVAAALVEMRASADGSLGDLAVLVAIFEAVDAAMGGGVGVGVVEPLSPTPVPAPRVVVAPVVAPPVVAPAAAPVVAPALAPAAQVAPFTEADFAAQITRARTLRELATLGVKVARAGLPKDATDRLQVAYQARKAGLGGKAPVVPSEAPAGAPQAPVVPRGAAPVAPAPPMPPAAQTPASGAVAAPAAVVVAAVAMPAPVPAVPMASRRWVAARFFQGGGRQILGYVSAATNQDAIGAAEAKWGTGCGVGVMDLGMCSALELAEADKAVGRSAPTGVPTAAAAGNGKHITVEMPEGFTADPDAQSEEEE